MHTNYLLADEATIERMAKDTSREVMPALIQVYCDELIKRRDSLNMAIHNSDIHEIGEQAHAIKSSSGTFGAQRLRESSSILEVAAAESEYNSEIIAKLVDDVKLILADTIEEYRLIKAKF